MTGSQDLFLNYRTSRKVHERALLCFHKRLLRQMPSEKLKKKQGREDTSLSCIYKPTPLFFTHQSEGICIHYFMFSHDQTQNS